MRNPVSRKNSIFAFMKIIKIDSLDLPELEVFSQLTEAQLRNRLEPEKGIFIAESLKVVRIALQCGMEPVAFLAERKYVDEQIVLCFSEHYDVPVYTGERELLSRLTGYVLSRGFLCAMRRPLLPSVGQVCDGQRRVVVMDGVVNSTNTGAVFRAAAALGIGGVLLTPTCCDPLNRRSVRVSMGTVFQLPWTFLGDSVADFSASAAFESLRQRGFKVVALALSDNAVSIDNPQLSSVEKMAIVLGTEGDGLSNATIAACDYVAKIPMQHGVDSLNVAAAAAVSFWQLRCG